MNRLLISSVIGAAVTVFAGLYQYQCAPTLSELRQRSVNIRVVQRVYGKIQTGHIPPSAETHTVWLWQVAAAHKCACAR